MRDARRVSRSVAAAVAEDDGFVWPRPGDGDLRLGGRCSSGRRACGCQPKVRTIPQDSAPPVGVLPSDVTKQALEKNLSAPPAGRRLRHDGVNVSLRGRYAITGTWRVQSRRPPDASTVSNSAFREVDGEEAFVAMLFGVAHELGT